MKSTLVIAFAAALSLACRESSGPIAGVLGTYTLVSINGAPLPANSTARGSSVRVVAGAIVLSQDYTFIITTAFATAADVQAAPTQGTCRGWWDSILTFDLVMHQRESEGCDERTMTASWDGSHTFTLVSEGSSFVYRE
jgi:hypothetical protein